MWDFLSTALLCLCAWGFIGILIGSLLSSWKQGVIYCKRLHRIPCHRCIYFTGEMQLKCTVHPELAFTEQAIGCRDCEFFGQQSTALSQEMIVPVVIKGK